MLSSVPKVAICFYWFDIVLFPNSDLQISKLCYKTLISKSASLYIIIYIYFAYVLFKSFFN